VFASGFEPASGPLFVGPSAAASMLETPTGASGLESSSFDVLPAAPSLVTAIDVPPPSPTFA
jgi:hypothetical protein